MAAEAPHRAEPTKWSISARTSHDAHGVGASNWPGPTLASTARVLANARLSCRGGTGTCLLSTVDDPLWRFSANQAAPPVVAEGRPTGRPSGIGKGIAAVTLTRAVRPAEPASPVRPGSRSRIVVADYRQGPIE